MKDIGLWGPKIRRAYSEMNILGFADTDFGRAVDAVVAQIFTLNGQRCTAGSRLIAEEPVYEDLVQAVAERARALRVGDPFDESTELGPLIRPEHHARVTEYLESAVADGARCLAGGGRPERLPEGNFLEATVFADVAADMRVFREEIFGPVLVATPFRDEEEAIRLANATEYGLAGYVWTNDLTRGHRVAQAIDAGRAAARRLPSGSVTLMRCTVISSNVSVFCAARVTLTSRRVVSATAYIVSSRIWLCVIGSSRTLESTSCDSAIPDSTIPDWGFPIGDW
jgi:hypothetical protein